MCEKSDFSIRATLNIATLQMFYYFVLRASRMHSLVECVVALDFLSDGVYTIRRSVTIALPLSVLVVTVESHEDTLVKKRYGWQGIPRIYATRLTIRDRSFLSARIYTQGVRHF